MNGEEAGELGFFSPMNGEGPGELGFFSPMNGEGSGETWLLLSHEWGRVWRTWLLLSHEWGRVWRTWLLPPMNRGGVWRALLLVDEFAQHQRQDAAVVHVANLRFVVDPRAGGEAHSRSVVGGSLDLNLLTRLQRVQAVDRVALLPGETKQVRIFAGRVLQRKNAHPDEVGAVDPLEALRDHGADTEQERTFRCPVARGAGAVLLAGEHDEWNAF